MNTDALRAEVEAMIQQLTPEIDWSRPEPYHPLFVAFSFQMATAHLLMQPENQLAIWRAAMNPANYFPREMSYV